MHKPGLSMEWPEYLGKKSDILKVLKAHFLRLSANSASVQ